ncbi:hypothetical protein RDWZM_002663 [Blomia tropicalis]|uniref:Transmembrane protein n=1 Tax=Blomia tropicalis TaxID=40697 RepID=A0A9Q0MD73_BLOTA|nr:hypothetical protein RDWZM_002663 [Blomia tropicalis]
MDSFSNSPLKRIPRLSDVVTSIMPNNRQKGVQTIIFQTLAILLSVSILFLLSQIYFIFQPCLKALLWALLCGSALYPFKVKLNDSLQTWLEDLDQTNQSFFAGLLTLPFKCFYQFYCWLIDFISSNKIIFIAFHFRFQMLHAATIVNGIMFTILSHNKGIITTFAIVCSSAQVALMLLKNSNSIFQVLSSFNFLPSILMFTLFYLLHCIGLIGHILFAIFFVISFTGFVFTVYNIVYNPNLKSTIMAEINVIIQKWGEILKEKSWKWLQSTLGRYNMTGDSLDNGQTNLSKQYISILFTIFLFVIAEQMQLSNILLTILCVHLVMIKLIMKIFERFNTFFQHWFDHLSSIKSAITVKLEKDILFKFCIYFFLKGDRLIRKTIHSSCDLLTSLGVISIVTIMIAFFSVLLSIKIYGEFYSTIHLVRNEVAKIEYIKDSINLTLNVSNLDYLNYLISENKWNIKEEDKQLINKVLIEFGENILTFLNVTSTHSLNHSTVALDPNINATAQPIGEITAISFQSMFTNLSLSNLKKFNFEILLNFANFHAKTYLPLFKGFFSILYAFIFVILDGGSFVLSFVLNSIIFTLALFYLLSTSRTKYKPIELLDSIVASLFTQNNNEKTRFSGYVEEVVNSIFAATINISAFYGIYTWLLHSLFGMRLCCIPAVVAAILAAVPILNAYWASLPACIYLYYFDTKFPLVKSIIMFMMAIMPSFIVDSSIYSDIKRGGHPYLTGLAITCGVVYYGVEGALFGPLWLCFLFIVLHMCTTLTENNLNISTSDTT